MKHISFERPYCEVVRFNNNVISTSACRCFDGEDDWGTVCTNDSIACECEINHEPGTKNCTPCSSFS